MNNSEIAEKNGIKEFKYEFFSEEALKFYPKNDVERIKKDTIGLYNLNFSEYEHSEDNKYYVKTNNTINYEFDGKEYELFEYEDCFTYYTYLCNKKYKKYRNILLTDYKSFEGDGVYLYKDNYYCHYYESIKSLLFFNRNQFIAYPGPFIMADLTKPKAPELISKYFDIENGIVSNKKNITQFYESDDESILVYFNGIYRDIMGKVIKNEKPTFYKNAIEDEEKDLDKLEKYSETDRFWIKTMFLYAKKEYRDFCNEWCSPELFNKELLKNGEVRKNLKNNFWIYHEFNSSLRNPNSNFIEGEDFTFLILNAIKALEYLLYRKISNYQNVKEFNYDDEITDRAMLDKMINYIKEHKDIIKRPSENLISKDNFDSIIKAYIDLLFYVKNECRNGYFHKHRIDNYESLCKKREKVMEAIAKTIIILK